MFLTLSSMRSSQPDPFEDLGFHLLNQVLDDDPFSTPGRQSLFLSRSVLNSIICEFSKMPSSIKHYTISICANNLILALLLLCLFVVAYITLYKAICKFSC